jgi:uncharacterized membrane protein (UPF0127 family)
MRLINTTKNTLLAEHVERATKFADRLRGLLGRNSLASNSTLWIDRCPSIHTFFMRFAIDVVFVDREHNVRACYENVGPWRWLAPVRGARSVYEFSVGTIARGKIEVGDQLNVVH